MFKYIEAMIARPHITSTIIWILNISIGVVGYLYNLEIPQLIILVLLSLSTTLISYVKGLRAGRLFSVLEFKKNVVEYRNRDFSKEDEEIAYHREDNL